MPSWGMPSWGMMEFGGVSCRVQSDFTAMLKKKMLDLVEKKDMVELIKEGKNGRNR